MPNDQSEKGVDRGELWRIDELAMDSKVYRYTGERAPHGTSAVAKAKQQYALEHDVDYDDLLGKKIDDGPHRRDIGPLVVVIHRPPGSWQEVA